MKAISLIQPWAQLIVDGRKPHETRSWPLPGRYRGELMALHASKNWESADRDCAEAFGYEPVALPRGAIVGLVRFGACMETSVAAEGLTLEEQSTGDYTPGRWAWRVDEVVKLREPVPCRGALGVWEVPAEAVALREFPS